MWVILDMTHDFCAEQSRHRDVEKDTLGAQAVERVERSGAVKRLTNIGLSFDCGRYGPYTRGCNRFVVRKGHSQLPHVTHELDSSECSTVRRNTERCDKAIVWLGLEVIGNAA